MRLSLTALVTLLLLASPAAAQDGVCVHQPAIVSIANSIIEKREELSGFPQRNFGTDAAYLKICYQPLADAEAEALIVRLIEGRARTIDELAFSWSYGKDNGSVTQRLLGDDAVKEAVSTNSASAMRAMLDAGDADALVQVIAELPEEPPHSAYGALLVAALDLPDSDKSNLAKLALQKGEPLLAAQLVAAQSKPKAWLAFLDVLADPLLIDQATQLWRWVPALVGNPELPTTDRIGPSFDPAARKKIHDVFIVAALEPQVTFLPTILNQTGRTDDVATAAQLVRDAIESGTVARDGLFGPAWLIAYRALRQSWGDLEDLEANLRGFQMNFGPGVDDTPLALLDRLVAVDALTPYLKGETDALPAAPSNLSEGFSAWPDWLAAAERIKANPADPALAEETTLPIAAELLLASGDSAALADLVAAAPTTSPLLHLATDVAIRLDRLCERYLAHPAEALLLAGQSIYKFNR